MTAAADAAAPDGTSATGADGDVASAGSGAESGAAGTIAFVDPARKLRGTVMVNYFPGEKWPLRADLNTALNAEHPK